MVKFVKVHGAGKKFLDQFNLSRDAKERRRLVEKGKDGKEGSNVKNR